MRWLKDKPEFQAQYARARAMQADSFFDKAVWKVQRQHRVDANINQVKKIDQMTEEELEAFIGQK